MRKSIGAAVTLLLAGATVTPGLADQPGSDWISVEQAMSKLKDAGYSSISRIEADDGYWEGEGVKNGQKHEFDVDPHTGAITKDEVDH